MPSAILSKCVNQVFNRDGFDRTFTGARLSIGATSQYAPVADTVGELIYLPGHH